MVENFEINFLKGPSIDFFKTWFFQSPFAWVKCQEKDFPCKMKFRLGTNARAAVGPHRKGDA